MPNFLIEIKFSGSGRNEWWFSSYAKPSSVHSLSDKITYGTKKIIIAIQRSKKPIAPFSNHNNTISKQIIKALCVFYTYAKTPMNISSISINQINKKGKSNKIQEIKSTNGLRQPFSNKCNFSELKGIKVGKLLEIQEETSFAKTKLNCISHLLFSYSIVEENEAFDAAWRAFNAIYKLYSEKEKDSDCHRFICEKLREDIKKFPLVNDVFDGFTTDDISRIVVQFIKMLQVNHPTEKRTKALFESIKRNKDYRVLKLYKEKITVRKDYLLNLGLWNDLHEFLNTQIAIYAKEVSDIVCLICVKYAYYIRNKIVHAEQPHHILRTYNNHTSITNITRYLQLLTIDIFNLCENFAPPPHLR